MTIADLLSIAFVVLGIAWGLNPPKWLMPVLRIATLTVIVAGVLFLEEPIR